MGRVFSAERPLAVIAITPILFFCFRQMSGLFQLIAYPKAGASTVTPSDISCGRIFERGCGSGSQGE